MGTKRIISLDIGGTNTRVALINEAYKIEKTLIRPTVTGNLKLFLESVSSIIDECVANPSKCDSISIGVPGRVRWDGYIYALPNIHIDSIPLAKYLHKKYKMPVYVRNDAEVAALAEAVAGPFQTCKSLYFITISTGVGGALTVGGKLRNSSYEAGHTMTELHGELHEFEHLASGHYLVRLASMKGVTIEGAKEFFQLVKARDPKILPIYEDWISLFAGFINMTQKNFEPEVFALTGGVMKSADVFLADLKKACPDSRIEKCYFDQEAGLIGAAVYALQMEK